VTSSGQYTFQMQVNMTLAVWCCLHPGFGPEHFVTKENMRTLPVSTFILQAADICNETPQTAAIVLVGA
jgi:hypothetical protein